MRSRTHILEEESLFELKNILPKEWVLREKPKDYGIDVEIEIFNSKGDYTGLVFWIQLKGTDSTNVNDHKSINMTIAKIRQLGSYDLPVAIFRYNSTNRAFYFEWISRYGYLCSSSNKKSFNIQFEDHHLWTKESPNQIILFLNKRNRYSSGSFSFPIKGYINNINAANKIARILSAKISKNINLIDLVRDRYLADIEINLLENRIVINLSGSYGGSIGYKKKDKNDDDIIFEAFKLCFLLILFQTDKDNDLFNFINDNDLLNVVINHPEMLQYLLPKLIASESGNHFTQEIVDHAFKSGDPITNALIEFIIFLSGRNILPRERVESYFNQVINLSLDSKNDLSLATSYYNFGGYYRGIYQFKNALQYYNKAFKTDKTYLERGYFCREVAGILFESKFYKLSAKFYEKASNLEPENIIILATLGDAEFYSGNFEKALKYFDDFLIKNINSNHDKYEFSLKFTICKALIEFLDEKSQKRRVKKSIETLKTYSNEDLQDINKVEELIKLDVLNPLVWNYLSIIYLKEQDLIKHFLASLMQAVLIKKNAKIWAYLTILITYEGAPVDLLNDIVNTAYFYCREDFLFELQQMIEAEEYKNFKGDEFLILIESLIKTPKEYPMELRFWDEDNIRIIEL